MRAFYRLRLFFLLLFLTYSFAWADGRYITSDPEQYRVRYLVEVKNSGGPARNVVLQVPTFMSDGLPPYQRLLSCNLPRGVKIINTVDGPNAEYTVDRLNKGQNLFLEFDYNFTNYAIDYQLSPYRGYSSADDRFLQPETGIESDAVAITELARRLTAGCGTQLEKARKLFDYINTNLEYQRVEQETHSALETLKIGKGVCEDFSLAYIALCRASAVPARFVRGYRFNESELRTGETDLKPYAHAWVEINLPAEGWVSVDPTFIFTINGVKAVSYDFFGKIYKSDRHLFFSYIRNTYPSCSWSHDQRDPANLSLNVRTLLQKR